MEKWWEEWNCNFTQRLPLSKINFTIANGDSGSIVLEDKVKCCEQFGLIYLDDQGFCNCDNTNEPVFSKIPTLDIITYEQFMKYLKRNDKCSKEHTNLVCNFCNRSLIEQLKCQCDGCNDRDEYYGCNGCDECRYFCDSYPEYLDCNLSCEYKIQKTCNCLEIFWRHCAKCSNNFDGTENFIVLKPDSGIIICYVLTNGGSSEYLHNVDLIINEKIIENVTI